MHTLNYRICTVKNFHFIKILHERKRAVKNLWKDFWRNLNVFMGLKIQKLVAKNWRECRLQETTVQTIVYTTATIWIKLSGLAMHGIRILHDCLYKILHVARPVSANRGGSSKYSDRCIWTRQCYGIIRYVRGEILKSRSPEMRFPAFWANIL